MSKHHIKTGNGPQDVQTNHGVANPYMDQNKADHGKQDEKQRVESTHEAIKRDGHTLNKDTGRPISMPGQVDGLQDNTNHPYTTEGKSLQAEVDPVQEKRDAAVKAEMNGHPAGAQALREEADRMEKDRKHPHKHEQAEKDAMKESDKSVVKPHREF